MPVTGTLLTNQKKVNEFLLFDPNVHAVLQEIKKRQTELEVKDA